MGMFWLWRHYSRVALAGILSSFMLCGCGGSGSSGTTGPALGPTPSAGEGNGRSDVVIGGPGRIAYLRQNIQTGSFHLHMVDPDGKNAVDLNAGDDLAEYSGQSWSPDGSQISFASNRSGNANFNIFIMKADGTDIRIVVDNSGGDFASSWSPDGQKMLFQAWRSDETFYDIYVTNLDGTEQKVLVNSNMQEELATWSPDGTKVAYQARPSSGSGTDIFLVNADGTSPTRLTDGNGALHSAPAWSPDSRFIAFESNHHQPPPSGSGPQRAHYEIYIMNQDGSNLRRLTFLSPFSEVARFPTWSPDGRQIAFEFHKFDSEAVFGVSTIVVINVDGTNVYAIPNLPVGARFPKWSPVP